MKISHISDIHGDLEKLISYKDWAIKTKPDVVVCTGDLTGPCLEPEESKQVQYAHAWLRSNFQADVPFNVLFQALEKKEDLPEPVKEAIKDYTEVELKFDKNSREQCNEILGIFTEFPQPLLTVPGNWDSKKQYFEYFDRFDIHKKTKEVEGVEFTGYGSSDIFPAALPPTRIIEFSEDELYNLFTSQMPEIAVTHTPPKGVLDRTLEKNHLGSWANLAYIRNPDKSSVIMLCGHCHESRGAQRPEGLSTLVVNPGNLGKYRDSPKNGTFAEIEYNGPAEPIKVKHYQIGKDGNVSEIRG